MVGLITKETILNPWERTNQLRWVSPKGTTTKASELQQRWFNQRTLEYEWRKVEVEYE